MANLTIKLYLTKEILLRKSANKPVFYTRQQASIIFKIKILYLAQQTVNLALKSDAMVYWLVTVFLNNSDWTTLCNCIILWDMQLNFFYSDIYFSCFICEYGRMTKTTTI
jgi:hypothetical protein